MSVFGGNQRYAVASVDKTTDPEYTTGYSPALKAGGSSSGESLPDNVRIGKRETPIPGRNWNDPRWQRREDSEFLRRMSSEDYELQGPVRQYKIPAPNVPYWTQERLPTRPTATMNPAYRTFQRPWHIPRNIKDAVGENATQHMSLANHERKYKIFGMVPRGKVGVNTYRAQPRPWDEDLFYPPQAGNAAGGIAGNRNYRL
jgi:hypothetical protein